MRGAIWSAISNGAACTSQSYTCSHVLSAMRLPAGRKDGAVRFSWCAATAGARLAGARGRSRAVSQRRRGPAIDVSAVATRRVYYRRSRFTTHLPLDRRYSPAHYWLLEESPGVWRVGFTKFATRMLGDIVEFEFGVDAGSDVEVGDEIGSIEGLKAVTSVFAAGAGAFLGEGHAAAGRMSPSSNPIPTARAGCIDFRVNRPLTRVDVEGYVAILDATIDRMLASRHAGRRTDSDEAHRG